MAALSLSRKTALLHYALSSAVILPFRCSSFLRHQSANFYRSLTNTPYSSFATAAANNKMGLSLPVDLTVDEKNHVEQLFQGIIAKKRASLAQGITLIESSHPRRMVQAQHLLSKVLHHNKEKLLTLGPEKALSFRIGLSGPPGAGKSTFLEYFGKFLTKQGRRVAVLAVDPSSSTTGGSLLGDKTRMQELSRDMNAYIRPSPAAGHLGGVTRSTSEAIILCEGAGYDFVFVETVGVGQSEYAVADMVDLFVLLIPPAGGDELQGLKRGIVERAHLVVVTKADGDLKEAAMRIQYEYMSALKFMRPISPNWRPQVLSLSSSTGQGMTALWETMLKFRNVMLYVGELEETRQKQQKIWMWNQITTHLIDVFKRHQAVQDHVHELESEVENGNLTPGQAADLLISYFLHASNES